ncbi:MAG: hypothetical protein RXR52_13150 [Paraburkholderia sp.]|jgi:hypothetical protein|uniref:hypothetical protein n=2 Tax=Burkholderiaceae TaxID=119060 RepID=UPI001485A319|nr:hypothetical protein [Burkholderia sp. 4M9327F10]
MKSKMETVIDEVPETNPLYRDDGDLMRALGCMTYEAAHFEAALDWACEIIGRLVKKQAKTKNEPQKIAFCHAELKSGAVACPNQGQIVEWLSSAKELVYDRNAAIHGRLYQPFNEQLRRAKTQHGDDIPISSAELYELANNLQIGRMYLTFVANYSRPAEAETHGLA